MVQGRRADVKDLYDVHSGTIQFLHVDKQIREESLWNLVR